MRKKKGGEREKGEKERGKGKETRPTAIIMHKSRALGKEMLKT